MFGPVAIGWVQTHGKLQESAAAKQLGGGGIFPSVGGAGRVLVSIAVPELIWRSWV
jgi:hypothetical protein